MNYHKYLYLKGGENMTVGTQMQKAIAGIQSAASTMKTFALETEDTQAKQDYQQIAQQLDSALQILQGRQQYIEKEEPQYKQQ
jgi:hypothetical protein